MRTGVCSAGSSRSTPPGVRSAANAAKYRTWPAGPTGPTGLGATPSATPKRRSPMAELKAPETSDFIPQTSMNDSLTVIDNRTGKKYELPIQDGTIRGMDLRQIKTGPEDFGLMTYDPAFMNTANCRSSITYIDGDKGVLLYRGYPIEELAEHSDYLETAYLIIFGELPTAAQLQAWTRDITLHTMLHENVKTFMQGFQYDAHPMGIFLSTVGALSTFNRDAKQIFDRKSRLLQMNRLIAKVPTIAAYSYRHSIGRPYNQPDNELSFTGNFLNMLFKMTELKYQPNPVLARALDVLFILHADHEQNCSTSAMRAIGSSQVDPYSAMADRKSV